MQDGNSNYNSSNSNYNGTPGSPPTGPGPSGTSNSGPNSSNVTINAPTSRTISFTISSTPNGASIFIDNVNSNFITPHTMRYTEKELLIPKTLFVRNGSATSGETYIISAELVTQTSNGTSPPGGGPYSGSYNP